MYSGMSIELMGMSDRRSEFSALTFRCQEWTYSLNYTPEQEVGTSEHYFPAVDLERKE